MIPPFGMLQQVMQAYQVVRKDPNQLNNILLQRGCITQQQYQDMQQKGIGGNPEAVGNYMMSQGIFNPQQAQDAYQQQAVPIQNSMRQN